MTDETKAYGGYIDKEEQDAARELERDIKAARMRFIDLGGLKFVGALFALVVGIIVVLVALIKTVKVWQARTEK